MALIFCTLLSGKEGQRLPVAEMMGWCVHWLNAMAVSLSDMSIRSSDAAAGNQSLGDCTAEHQPLLEPRAPSGAKIISCSYSVGDYICPPGAGQLLQRVLNPWAGSAQSGRAGSVLIGPSGSASTTCERCLPVSDDIGHL